MTTEALAALYRESGTWSEEIASQLASFDFVQSENLEGMGCAVINLGVAMMQQKQYQLAQKHFETAVSFLQDSQLPSHYAIALRYLGIVSYQQGAYAAAMKWLEKALSAYCDIKDVTGEVWTLSWLGQVYCTQQKFLYGLACYEAALDLCSWRNKPLECFWLEVGLRFLIAKLCQKCNHPELAVPYCLEALEVSQFLEPEWSIRILQELSQIYESLKDNSMATYYTQRANRLAKKDMPIVDHFSTLQELTRHHPLSLYL